MTTLTIEQEKSKASADMDALTSMGYLNFLEFRSKADWPKTMQLMPEDHYVFFCKLEDGTWERTFGQTPTLAVDAMLVKIGLA